MKKDRKCKYCKKIFENIEGKIFSNHVKGCKENPNNKDINENLRLGAEERETKKHGPYCGFEVKCYKCGVNFCIKERERKFPQKEKYFCCRSCANSRTNSGPKSKESRKLVSEKTKKLGEDPKYVEKQMESNKKLFSSKGEEDLKEYFKGVNPEDGGTSGGSLKIENQRITRDLYSKKLKICIEYDGIWHFKDIKNQLDKKKHKDGLLEDGCLKNGYKLIRIDDELYGNDPYYGKHIILDEAYNGDRQVVKFGDKY